MNNLRTFIAIEIPVSQGLRQTWNDLKLLLKDDRIRWVNDKTLHLTLFFLGDTPVDQIGKMKEALSGCISKYQSFPLAVKGMGTFGAPSNPKVIWIGIEGNDTLNQLYLEVNTIIETFGYPRDERGFNPHITLGRVSRMSNPMALKSFTSSVKQELFLTHMVTGVIMYQSTLTPNGSIYKPLWNIPLSGSE